MTQGTHGSRLDHRARCVEAVDGPDRAFTCTEIRRRGPPATPAESCAVPCAIGRAMTGAGAAWRAAWRAVSIADLVQDVGSDSGPRALAGIGAWLSAPDA
ncbi:hypothetical protein [Streptomyces avermitilis]|uniref:hypothetical protein n=1 Tax=Streptomyces avermitilis TaxID=33903 RepID=UPI003714D1B0